MMSGWIKIHRVLAEHWLADQPEKLGWWVLLLLKVEREDKRALVGNQVIELKRGQIIASNSFLANLWKTSERTVGRFLDLLEKEQMLHRCMHRKTTILTICNFDSYQENRSNRRTDVCTDSADIVPTSCRQIREDREDKNISKTTTAPAYTHEADYIRQYRTEGRWRDASLILHLKSVGECESLFDRWILEYQHKGQTHDNYTDFKAHFIQWARITIQKEKSNGNDSRQNQRRGVQVVANSPEDYEGPF